MQLTHNFTVPADIEQAWEVLLDIERIAPCMPGAALDTVDGDEFTGSVKVRLGPIGLTYRGKARWRHQDADSHRAVIDAQGKDARGNGTAKATITATLTARGEQHRGDGGDRPDHHRQAGPVRPGRDGRCRQQADRAVRRLPGRQAGRTGSGRGRCRGCGPATRRCIGWCRRQRPAAPSRRSPRRCSVARRPARNGSAPLIRTPPSNRMRSSKPRQGWTNPVRARPDRPLHPAADQRCRAGCRDVPGCHDSTRRHVTGCRSAGYHPGGPPPPPHRPVAAEVEPIDLLSSAGPGGGQAAGRPVAALALLVAWLLRPPPPLT